MKAAGLTQPNGRLPRSITTHVIKTSGELQEPDPEESFHPPDLKERCPQQFDISIPPTQYRILLPDPPRILHTKRSTFDEIHSKTSFAPGRILFRPLLWHFRRLTRIPPDGSHHGTTLLELAIDFEASTGAVLRAPGVPGSRTARRIAQHLR